MTINQTDARAWIAAGHIQAKLRPVIDYHKDMSGEISSLLSEYHHIRRQFFELKRFTTFPSLSVGAGIVELLSKASSLLMLADTSADGRVLLGPAETSFVNNVSTDRLDAEIKRIRDTVRLEREFLQAVKEANEAAANETNQVVDELPAARSAAIDEQTIRSGAFVAACVIVLMVVVIAFAIGGANG